MAVILVALALAAGAPTPSFSHTLTEQQLRVLNDWLRGYPTYRLATDTDSACPAYIAEMGTMPDTGVWKRVPGYHPHQVTGDFNGDGATDFAAVLLDKKGGEEDPYALVIFNGPFSQKLKAPAFFEAGLELGLDCGGLFIGPPRPMPYRLVAGPFHSDSGGVIVPSGETYVWDTSDGEGSE